MELSHRITTHFCEQLLAKIQLTLLLNHVIHLYRHCLIYNFALDRCMSPWPLILMLVTTSTIPLMGMVTSRVPYLLHLLLNSRQHERPKLLANEFSFCSLKGETPLMTCQLQMKLLSPKEFDFKPLVISILTHNYPTKASLLMHFWSL